jgi:hypothetical protein
MKTQTYCLYIICKRKTQKLILRPWRWRRYVPPKRQLTFNGLHGIVSQKIEVFITTAVRTSNPTLEVCSEHYARSTWAAFVTRTMCQWYECSSSIHVRCSMSTSTVATEAWILSCLQLLQINPLTWYQNIRDAYQLHTFAIKTYAEGIIRISQIPSMTYSKHLGFLINNAPNLMYVYS